MYIYSFSRSQKDIKDRLYDRSKPCQEHLMKIFLFPHAQEQNHWIGELYSFLHDTEKLKGSNKFPSKQFILDNTWGVWEDTIYNYIPSFLEDYEDLNPRQEDQYENVYNAIKQYMCWLSEELSKTGRVSRKAVTEEIRKLESECF